jgi:hypothetical protein
VGQVYGHHTFDQMVEWLDEAIQRFGMWEPWLVESVVLGIDRELDDLVEGYGAGAERRRQMADDIEELRQDPDRLAAFEGSLGESADPSGERLLNLIAMLRERASLTELRDRRVARDEWRRLALPIIDSANINAWVEDQVLGSG